MDILTASRDDSTLYCITSKKKIINHRLFETEGAFLGCFYHVHSSNEGP